GIWLADRDPNIRESVTLFTAGVNAIVVLTILGRVLAGERPEAGGWEIFGG
ncbi:MAG: monovalent cation/H+ antiporter subunit D family protein, partial [Xanthomonadales bacterium]|nr:monovalent cation/H+ antiporter subunit D family protein [Xanthomonadales bacterium]